MRRPKDRDTKSICPKCSKNIKIIYSLDRDSEDRSRRNGWGYGREIFDPDYKKYKYIENKKCLCNTCPFCRGITDSPAHDDLDTYLCTDCITLFQTKDPSFIIPRGKIDLPEPETDRPENSNIPTVSGQIYAYVEYGPLARGQLVKIGKTKNDVSDRITQVRTGNASPLKCYKYLNVPIEILGEVESMIHRALLDYNTNKKHNIKGGTEWFAFSTGYEFAIDTIFDLLDEYAKRGVDLNNMEKFLPQDLSWMMDADDYSFYDVMKIILEEGVQKKAYGGYIQNPKYIFEIVRPIDTTLTKKERKALENERERFGLSLRTKGSFSHIKP